MSGLESRKDELISKAVCSIKPGYLHHLADTYWGKSLRIIEKESAAALVAVSWYDDCNPDCAYIEGLSVSFKYRELGYGRELMDMAEDVCRCLERQYAVLYVVKGSWQEEWYHRRGYEDCDYTLIDEELITLRKDLGKVKEEPK